MQSTQQIVSFDGPSRSQPDQHFVINPSATSLPVNNSFSLTPPMTSIPQSSTIWSDPNNPQLSFDDQTANDYYGGYSTVVTSSEQENSLVRGIEFSGVPRTWPPYDPRMLEHNMAMEGFDQVYMLDNDKNDTQSSTHQAALDLTKAPHYVRLSMSQSPKVESDSQEPHLSPSKETGPDSEDGDRSSREMTAMDVDEHTTDEPYAKLIHRALMSVPSHSMVLQEIYQWFRDNTGKGSGGPESKGWMNSIRHNLSMNAVRHWTLVGLGNWLTLPRLSRKQNAKYLGTTRKSLPSGCLRNLQSRTVSSQLRDIAKAQEQRSSWDLITQPLLVKALDEKVVYLPTKWRDEAFEKTEMIPDALCTGMTFFAPNTLLIHEPAWRSDTVLHLRLQIMKV